MTSNDQAGPSRIGLPLFGASMVAIAISTFYAAVGIAALLPVTSKGCIFAILAVPLGYLLIKREGKHGPLTCGQGDRTRAEMIVSAFAVMPLIVVLTELAPTWESWIFGGVCSGFFLLGPVRDRVIAARPPRLM
jgi:hypothetical protein